MATNWKTQTLAAINSGTLAEGKIRTMRTILARATNAGEAPWMAGSRSCDPEDVREILQAIEEVQPFVSADQARKGAAWLRANLFTKSGQVRKTEFARQFSAHDLQVVELIAGFRLVELYDTREHGERYCNFFPVYRAIATNGDFFDYVARAWQSGGNSFVINRGSIQE